MADRSFLPPKGSLEVDVVALYGSFDVGATGAPTKTTTSNKGVSTVVRNSAGKYTITLSDRYNALLWADVQLHDDTNSAQTVGILWRLYSEAVNNATPTLVIQFVDTATGAAADPASGAKVYVKLELRNSSVS